VRGPGAVSRTGLAGGETGRHRRRLRSSDIVRHQLGAEDIGQAFGLMGFSTMSCMPAAL